MCGWLPLAKVELTNCIVRVYAKIDFSDCTKLVRARNFSQLGSDPK